MIEGRTCLRLNLVHNKLFPAVMNPNVQLKQPRRLAKTSFGRRMGEFIRTADLVYERRVWSLLASLNRNASGFEVQMTASSIY